MNQRRPDLILLLILLAALLYRLALWAQPLHQPANDENEYIAVAYDLLAGRGWVFYDSYHWLRAPLYPLWLAGSLAFVGGDLHRAALPNLLLSTLNVGLIAILTRQLGGGRWAVRGVALAAAGLLTFATFASLYMAETLFTFLFTAAMVVLLHWRTRLRAAAHTGHWHWLVLAAVAYGLAVLTRSLPLAFLPVVLLWIGAVARGAGRRWVQAGRAALVFALLVAATLAPWTIRNCRAYTACILVETGFSFNMWAFNEPRESMAEILRVLEQIPDPAERAAFATAQGRQRIQEDPLILIRKIPANWLYLWRVRPIQDRFLMATYYADPPPVLFIWAVLADDLLYLVLTAMAGGGAVALLWQAWHAPQRWWQLAPPLLVLGWIGYVVVATMFTHGEARYRHFFLPQLLALAGAGLALVPVLWRIRTPQVLRWALLGSAAVVLGLWLYTALTSYPAEWARRGVGRSWHTLHGDWALARGDLAGAQQAYQQALRYRRSADSFINLGNVYVQQGELELAAENFRKARQTERIYVAASTSLGDVYRRMGQDEAARRAFVGTNVSEQDVLDWSWQHLTAPPPAVLEIGDGLDFGFIAGVYPAEANGDALVRWSNGHARLRLPLAPLAQRCPPGQACPPTPLKPPLLELRVAAPHPHHARVPMQVCAADVCQTVLLGTDWRVVQVALPRVPPDEAGVIEVQLRSSTFVAPDGRTLGVLLDWARLGVIGPEAEASGRSALRSLALPPYRTVNESFLHAAR